MENSKQAKLILALAKRLRAQKRTKEEAIASLVSSGILDKDHKFSKNYPTIRKLSESK
jgi:hypothetical protein